MSKTPDDVGSDAKHLYQSKRWLRQSIIVLIEINAGLLIVAYSVRKSSSHLIITKSSLLGKCCYSSLQHSLFRMPPSYFISVHLTLKTTLKELFMDRHQFPRPVFF